jgi:hypothetical protein
MEAYKTMCENNFCEYNDETQVIERYNFKTGEYTKICDIDIFENKRGVYVKISHEDKWMLLDEVDIDKIKCDSLKLSLLTLIEEEEESNRRFHEPDADDSYQMHRENN